ncbi:MAG: glycosyltransferase [Roseiflexaceae bacterium]
MTALVWHSSFASFTGYSGSSLALVLGLDRRGVAVRPLYLYGADHDEQIAAGRMHPRISELQQQPLDLGGVQVVYAPGDRLSKNSGRYRIGYTMHETDRLPREWVVQANQMDELWVPSTWGAEVFRASGITRPVYTVPLGIDPQIYRPGPPRQTLSDRTVFLSVFEWGPRKGWPILLEAYCRAFTAHDPVLLLLKIDQRAPGNPIPELAAHLPAAAPPISLIYNQGLSPARMAELYRSADCFVLPTHGEGWGMPILEAMACGTPAIATNWGAQTSFLSAENSFLLPIRGLIPADPHNRYMHGSHWADPDRDALVELLRLVVADPAKRQEIGKQAASAAQQWPWARGVAAIEQRLATIGSA